MANYRFSFSYSRWSTWKECPAKYKFKNIDRYPDPPSKAMERGNKVHQDVAKYVAGESEWMPDALKLFTDLARGLRDLPAHAKMVEEQMAFDRDAKPVTWFGPNAYWRFIWDVGVVGDRTVDSVDWKGLALDTSLATPHGWTTMGDVCVGDDVFAPDGTPTRVTGKSEVKNLRCFEITFDTNAPPIVCDAEHLWKVRRRGQKPQIVPAADVRAGDIIDLPAPVEPGGSLDRVDVHPYVLGCWLGDGHRRDGMISKPDTEMFDHIEACGYRVLPVQPSSDMGRTVVGLRGQLSAAGLLHNKHIPEVYFTLPAAQRQELVRGLMDSDGTWNKARRRAVFTSVDSAMARQVQSLVASLGERASLLTTRRTGFGRTVTAYEVHWSPTRFNPFRLSRKAELVRVRERFLRRMVQAKAVREVPSVPTQCIAVAHPSRMYLAGECYIPTHNTGSPRGSYDDQMQIFAIPAYWKYPDLEVFTGHLIYLDSGDSIPYRIDRAQFYGPSCDPASMDGLYGLWVHNVRTMEADQAFPAKPSREACKWCPFHAKKGGPCKDGV